MHPNGENKKRGNSERFERSHGGWTTKLHPLALTPGQTGDERADRRKLLQRHWVRRRSDRYRCWTVFVKTALRGLASASARALLSCGASTRVAGRGLWPRTLRGPQSNQAALPPAQALLLHHHPLRQLNAGFLAFTHLTLIFDALRRSKHP